MENEELLVLAGSSLFFGYQGNRLEELLKKIHARREDLSPGEEIPFETKGEHRMGIVLSGQLQVLSGGKERLPLNRLNPGDLFGVSSLFGEEAVETRILCTRPGRVLFLEEGRLEPLLEDPLLRRNLIAFLTGRIRFLNRKIAFYTAPAATGKLARYLAQHQNEEGRVLIPRGFSELARSLNLGRASLYRALGSLEEGGAITKEGKEIRILSRELMELFLS